MDPQGLAGLISLPAASLLLIYLLRLWVSERRYWLYERAKLVAEHNADRERWEAERERLVSEREDVESYWKARCDELEQALRRSRYEEG